MKSYLADLVRLFILVNLLVLALFTIPVNRPNHNTVNSDTRQLRGELVTVTDASSVTQQKSDF
jgi:hypothetical protein